MAIVMVSFFAGGGCGYGCRFFAGGGGSCGYGCPCLVVFHGRVGWISIRFAGGGYLLMYSNGDDGYPYIV